MIKRKQLKNDIKREKQSNVDKKKEENTDKINKARMKVKTR